MRNNVIVRAVLFVGVACAALDPQDASALIEQRVSPAICVRAPESGQPVYHAADGTIRNSAGGGAGVVYCPLQDNSNSDFADVDYIKVYVHDDGRRPSDHTKAQACITPYGVDGVFCGSPTTSPGYGYQELTLSNYWNGTSIVGFAQVRVELAYWTGGAGGPSWVEGVAAGYQ